MAIPNALCNTPHLPYQVILTALLPLLSSGFLISSVCKPSAKGGGSLVKIHYCRAENYDIKDHVFVHSESEIPR